MWRLLGFVVVAVLWTPAATHSLLFFLVVLVLVLLMLCTRVFSCVAC